MTEKETNKGSAKTVPDDFKKLSIQVSLNGLSFFVVDTISQEIVLADEERFETTSSPYNLLKTLKALFKRRAVLEKTYAEVAVTHKNDMFALVPKSLFEPNEMANYLKFNTKLLANDEIAFDELKNQDIVIVYVPFTNINNYVFELFGEFDYNHQSTLVLQTVFNQKNITEEVCYVHVSEKTFQLTALDGKKLLLYNQFQYQSKEDFLYYILFTYEQLNLDTERCRLLFFGAVDENDPTYKLCYQYIKHIAVFEPLNALVAPTRTGEDTIDLSLLNN